MLQQQVFTDRSEAGQQLAMNLRDYQGQDAIVLALPRGGVPIGFEIAKTLYLPLDCIVARKLASPSYPEFGIGAVAQNNIVIKDDRSIALLGLSEAELNEIIAKETEEMQRRILLYRGNHPSLELKDKIVILVDDGLATGVTALAAVRAIKLSQPKKLILAIPVCASQAAEEIEKEVDQLVCLYIPDNFVAVGIWYKNFEQLTDQQVIEILSKAYQEIERGKSTYGNR